MSEVKEIPYNKHPLTYRCGNCDQLIDVVDVVSWVFIKDDIKRFCSLECKDIWLKDWLDKEDKSTLDEKGLV